MNQVEALALCYQLEEIAPAYGLHIGLTGGCLYKSGDRKDLDIILYRIRQTNEPDLIGFQNHLIKNGWGLDTTHGWVQKMKTPSGQDVDFFYPEYMDKSSFWDRIKNIFSNPYEGGGVY